MTNQNQPSEVKEGGALAPCPFCRRVPAIKSRAGEKGEAPEVWSITCFGDGNTAHAWFYAATEAEAIAAWNRRPPSMERDGLAMLRDLYDFVDCPASRMRDEHPDVCDYRHEIARRLVPILAAAPSPAPSADPDEIKAAYQQGWSDREDDIIERAERILPAPSAVEMAGVEEKAARLIYAAFEEHDQDDWPWPSFDTNKQYYDAGKGANGYYWTAIRLAPVILALATASRGEGAES